MKKIIGIGNAIVDVVCKVDENFLAENSLIKGSMCLIDNVTAQKLSQLSAEKITSGGSVANSIAAVAQLGCKAGFIGKVGGDEFAQKFIKEIGKSGADFISQHFSINATAKSFILVTPDAERTMCTFLGCASEISENDIDEKSLQDSSVLYLEGYLWDRPETILALKKAINLAKKHGVKIAFSLSDLFCVARHKLDFIGLVQRDLDILFANEGEIQELVGVTNIAENNFAKLQEFFAINKKLLALVTRNDKGCVVFSENKITEVATKKVEKLTDTTGAGDCFAAGFLSAQLHGASLEKCAQMGNLLAAKIIQKFGARFDENEITEIKKYL